MRNNPSHFKNPDNPVEMVSWLEANEFIQRLNVFGGHHYVIKHRYRLPTEAEWEYAARGDNDQLHDMLDSFSEWTCTAPTEQYDDKNESLCNNDADFLRVYRHAYWSIIPPNVRSLLYRLWTTPTYRSFGLGFRLAQD